MLNVRMKALRKERKKTQQDIADILGISRPAYTAYEQGNRTPDNDAVEKLADYYAVSIDFLFGRTDNPSPISPIEQDEADFQAFANNPSLQKWYKELPKSREEDLEKLRKMWEIIKSSDQN